MLVAFQGGMKQPRSLLGENLRSGPCRSQLGQAEDLSTGTLLLFNPCSHFLGHPAIGMGCDRSPEGDEAYQPEGLWKRLDVIKNTLSGLAIQ